jgi:hypothetical protein
LLPKNPTPLQIFKEHILTNIGGDAKMDSNKTLPVRAFSSAVRPPGDDQR